ncbi:MAG TPA: UDP-N-acetylmuramoyl-tripeptide--D-alanyl-D-alanine ligase [Methylococcaceae bacterium]|nr:UDP-N-acetylmuramoyl-tripeptide--D-alanyl-D-alanine ligase [Methylococcaceae bacterium]
MMRLHDAAQMAGGKASGADVELAGVVTDSRADCAGALFVALQGPRFDGHDFVPQALQQGAAAALVSRPLATPIPQILAPDTRVALGRLAAAWRRRHPARVVGVTGSNGKTTVKEMLAAICAEAGPTLATRGNLNNDIGVPLTLLKLNASHRYAVIEMGANHPGEIAALSRLAGPEAAVITNAGAAHLEGFGSLAGVAQAKGELLTTLPATGVAVLNADDANFSLWREMAGERRVVSFGASPAAQVRVVEDTLTQQCGADGFVTGFDLAWDGKRYPLRLALAGRHNAVNAAAAVAAALALGLDMAQAQQGLARLQAVPGRLQAVPGRNGALLLNDSYNANPASFAAGLEALAHCPGERWVALGGFGELGADSAALHTELGRMSRRDGVTRLFATGPLADKAVDGFGAGGVYFSSQDELIAALRDGLQRDVVLLVKGSRSQKMERVVEALRATKDLM